MSVEFEVVGTGAFSGDKSNVGQYSYTEASTPIIPGDDSGGVGEFSVEVREFPRRTELLYKDRVLLRDDFYGEVTGFVSGVSSNDGVANVSGLSRLGSLNTDDVLPAGEGKLGDLLLDVFARANIVGDVEIESDIFDKHIVFPGFTGNLWIYLKNICTAYQLEVSLVVNTVYVRGLRKRELVTDNVSSESWSIEDIQLAQNVEVNYYNYEYFEDFLAYPKGGWNPDVPVYQVEANETVEFDIEVDAYLLDIEQPQVEGFVGLFDEDSVYSVSANDGLSISPQLWRDRGGDLKVSLAENGTIIRVVITGPNLPSLSPFIIGASDGANQYSTLRIRGKGVAFEEKTVTVPTGLTDAETSNQVGQTIDNPLISTFEEAYEAGVRARGLYALPKRSYSITGRQLFNPAQSEIPLFKTFAELDAALIGLGPYLTLDDPELGKLDINQLAGVYTFFEWDQQFDGFSFDDLDFFNTFLLSQSFGSLSGSRVRFREAFLRVREAQTTPEQVSVSADFDTLVSDFNNENIGRTFEDFRIAFHELTFNDFAMIPLRTDTTYPFLRLDDDVLGILDLNVLA